MSLTDRLEDAARARGEIVPERAPRPAPTPVIVLPPQPIDRREILAPASIRVTTVDPDPGALQETICPTCGRVGELSVVDLPRRSAGWSCHACATLWQVALPDPEAAPASEATAR